MLHIIKLCVGARDLGHLQAWQSARLAAITLQGLPREFVHTTRQTPKNRDALLSGGSLYWVINGFVLARQRMIDIRPEPDEHGQMKCGLVLAPDIIPTAPLPRRPFQGWRYFAPEDAPADLNGATAAMPHSMQKQLAALGLL